MKVRRIPAALAVTLSLAVCGLASLRAHHGTMISYDREKQWTAQATVTEFRYVNPHVQLFFDVKDKDGKVTHWNGEMLPNPAQLIASGWSRKRAVAALEPGTVVTVTALPAKAGGNVVLVMRVANEKGEDLLGAGPIPGAPPAAPRAIP
jgi:hypothetical protein